MPGAVSTLSHAKVPTSLASGPCSTRHRRASSAAEGKGWAVGAVGGEAWLGFQTWRCTRQMKQGSGHAAALQRLALPRFSSSAELRRATVLWCLRFMAASWPALVLLAAGLS